MMSEDAIAQLQMIVGENTTFSPEQKARYRERLEAFRGWQNVEMPAILTSLLENAREDPGAIKAFFDGMDDVVKTYVLKGEDGVAETINNAATG